MSLNFSSEFVNISGHILCSHVHNVEFITPEYLYLIELQKEWKRICTYYYTYFATKFYEFISY